MGDNGFEPHAVRWALREVRNELQYTRWHWSDVDCWTLCGHVVRLAVATFLPETDEDVGRVDCGQCLKRLNARD
jgi:hypothetical protein